LYTRYPANVIFPDIGYLFIRGDLIKIEYIDFKSGDLILVGAKHIPEGLGPFPAVVVCHPHPRYGGSMENNVINSVCESLASNSIVSLKFNFRGVDGSQGQFDNGVGETKDALAAIAFISSLKEVNQAAIGLLGYSAGAAWGLAAGCQDQRIKAVAAVSPPVTMFDFDFLKSYSLPKLLISGNQDYFVPIRDFEKLWAGLNEPRECVSVEDADHFWQGSEPRLSDIVANFFVRTLSMLPNNQQVFTNRIK
jgi:uncharacterized protein